MYAVVATLDRVYSDVDQALGIKVSRVITGGDADDLTRLLQEKAMHIPDLVLQGLAIIYQSMQEGDL